MQNDKNTTSGITDLFASFEDVCEQICRRLPEGWLIRIGIDSGWAGVTLFDPDDEKHDMGECGEMLTEQLRTALDKANARGSGDGEEHRRNRQSTKTMNIPTDIRELADHIEDISRKFDQLTYRQKRILQMRGWKDTCKTPGSVWMWEKQIEDGRTLLVSFEAAWCHESCAISYEAANATESGV